MKVNSCFVSLLDISESLPFSFKIKDTIMEEDGALPKLMKFVSHIEKSYKESVYFIGEDIIGEKFYYRFLFKKGGFLEIMAQPPVAIVGHFIDQTKAKRFSTALKKAVESTVKDRKTQEMMKNIIEISEGNEALSFNDWHKIRKVRSLDG
ncbi:hypothetical protein ACFLQN_02410 [Candidatus Aenigmatarchaeota archaeon]